MRFIVIIVCSLISKLACAQAPLTASLISASTKELRSGGVSVIASVGEEMFLGVNGGLYLGSGFYRSNGFVRKEHASSVQTISSQTNISVYPNPSNGKFTLTSEITQNGLIEIYNITGAKVFSQNVYLLAKASFDISQQNAGVYIVKISNAENVWTQRVIVE